MNREFATGEDVANGEDDGLESALWAAIRTMEERMNLLTKLASDARAIGFHAAARRYEERVALSQEHALKLREFLRQVRGAPASAEPSRP